MIDLENIIGIHTWQEIVINGNTFCVPDLNYCAKFIMLLVVVYFFIRGIFAIASMFK